MCCAWVAQGFSLKALQHLVLDEADRLLNMDFEQEIDQILKVSMAATAASTLQCRCAGFAQPCSRDTRPLCMTACEAHYAPDLWVPTAGR